MIKSFRKKFVLIICLAIAFASLSILTTDSGLDNNDDVVTIDAGDLSLSWSFLLTENVEKTPTAADLDNDNSREVLLPYGTRLLCFSNTGTSLWNFTANGDVCESPAVIDIDHDGEEEIIFAEW